MDQDNKEMPSIHGAFDKLGRQGLDWTGPVLKWAT